MPRFYVDLPLAAGLAAALPAAAARHAQVLRLQPGEALTLFNGEGGEWSAEITHMGRSEVAVQVGRHHAVDRELPLPITLAVGMPANDRMDWLVEKATELGVAALQPLVCERSVLRLAGDRAARKVEHWRGIAVAACEQSGRTRLPQLAPVMTLSDYLSSLEDAAPTQRFVLSLRHARPFAEALRPALHAEACSLLFVSGPEGGLTDAEESLADKAGCRPVSLGARTLRADTAPLMAAAALAALF
ncbi:16S rRNA (uracil(1498)-N(3))-methyltransferase [Methylibium rhizosphaerae]|uniref:16S rRNA (uracil(1498)-N(3))-methyltransferase n=1 Tax=Methylibium rhizosphaerae TaxID=2570323 RepID=UPI001128AE5C|nr:16S rRNA (uracil(1498)-N(3))-methyltransferase [Methylibium rhizosphaerae]